MKIIDCEKSLLLILTMLVFCTAGCPSKDPATPSPKASPATEDPEISQALLERRFNAASPEDFGNVPSDRPATQPIVRPATPLPNHDNELLKQHGIRRYESERMVLYSDIDPALAEPLPALVDQIFPVWERFYQPLKPAADGSPFRIVGYLMQNDLRYRELNLLPETIAPFKTGRHRGYQFWMLDQETDEYRRHLLLHEATHCFMTIMPNALLPKWYMEGMAELFGTQTLDEQGQLEFHLGRIKELREELAAGRIKTIDDIRAITFIDPVKETINYGWSWALCYFLDQHPRYKEDFRELKHFWNRGQLEAEFDRRFADVLPEMRYEWLLFVSSIVEEYDLGRAAIDFESGVPVSASSSPVSLQANRGWQSSGWQVSAGETYRVSATGQVTIATEPKPWISKPQGVSIRYFDGLPRGRLVGLIIDETSFGRLESGEVAANFWEGIQPLDLGRQKTFVAPASGTLYLRVNDIWNDLENNAGEYEVRIE